MDINGFYVLTNGHNISRDGNILRILSRRGDKIAKTLPKKVSVDLIGIDIIKNEVVLLTDDTNLPFNSKEWFNKTNSLLTFFKAGDIVFDYDECLKFKSALDQAKNKKKDEDFLKI